LKKYYFDLLNKLLGKKHHKRRSVSPSGAGDQGLYSDPEQQQQQQQQQHKEHNEPSEGQQDRSRSHSPTLASHSKQENAVDNNQQQQSQVVEGASGDATQGGVAKAEEEQAVGENEKRRSSSKKKKHHRRDRYDNYNIPPPLGVPIDINPNNPFQQPYPSQQYPQQPAYFGDNQSELPPQLKVYYSYNNNNNNSFKKSFQFIGSSSTTL